MKLRHRICAMSIVLLAAHVASAQTLCDDVNTMAGQWGGLAQAVAYEGITDDARNAIGAAGQTTQAIIDAIGPENPVAPALQGSLNSVAVSENPEQLVMTMADMSGLLQGIGAECSQSAPSAAMPGRLVVSYETAPELVVPGLAQGIQATPLYPEIAQMVSAVVVLPRDIPIVFSSCGTANAFYDPEQVRITMCYELFNDLARSVSQDEQWLDRLLGAGAFILMHEIGHALVHNLDLPITGREEDSVDGLATIVMLQSHGATPLLGAIEWFIGMAAASENDAATMAFWDEHSLSSQRFYEVSCLMLGSNPQAYGELVLQYLPEDRAVRCEGEYQKKERSWDQILSKHYHPSAS